MLVAVAIFFIITGAVLVNIPQFRSRVDVDLIAHEVMMYIRSVQAYSSGARQFEELLNAKVFYTKININSQSVENFAEALTDIFIEKYSFPSGYELRSIKCGDNDFSEIKIYFTRPNPSVSELKPNNNCGSSVIIEIYSLSDNNSRKIIINKSGHMGII